jgi:hypothetical protein
MISSVRILGVTVTHDSSDFVELMLRTLFLTNDLRDLDLTLAVLDNSSGDAHRARLESYLAEHRIPLTPTGFTHYIAAEQHGAALTDFVQAHPDCTHYLFLDADMWFIEPDTIATMLRELQTAPPGPFAVQARIFGYYLGRVYEGRDGIPGTNYWEDKPAAWPIEFEGRPYANRYAPRLSPVCSLIANTPLFRRVVDTVGLSQAIRFGVGEVVYHDTFSLMSHVMATHGQEFIVSLRTVNHFGQTTYLSSDRLPRDRDCALLLEELRAGRGNTSKRFLAPGPAQN